ncbi:hypothetical protein CVT24_009221 [Panaeolus cyanescens]|uniref:Uncharacterized protein n=1 Tax=Panaeolus cyanescens TaxID=181874 RepID=A0A409Y8F8_9AGAR|nr:hypothetical protein CVT24_009221 [Panaeolus cyanescens]
MTEYAIPSQQAYREFMSSRERTAYWVQRHAPLHDDEYYSPSIAPSVSEGFVPSAPSSDAGSTHSTPPKMVLRYGDGRPDIPIPLVPNGANAQSRSQRHSVDRTGSGSSAGHSRSSHSRHPEMPEEIRILPSASSKPKTHSRSLSLPRGADAERPFYPPAHMQSQSTHRQPHGHSSAPPHQVSFVQPPHHMHPRGHHPKHAPVPMMYPQGHHSGRPPLPLPPPHGMYHQQPQLGPNGMIYSHSAPPVPGQPHYPTPYASGSGSHRHTASAHDIRSHIHAPPMGRSGARRAGASAVSLGSENSSGNTYYILPAQGHNGKVHVIAPSPEQSVVTATSTTKSGSSSGKKPFFQRLFGFKFSSAASSVGGGGKLSRRHSIGSSGRA